MRRGVDRRNRRPKGLDQHGVVARPSPHRLRKRYGRGQGDAVTLQQGGDLAEKHVIELDRPLPHWKEPHRLCPTDKAERERGGHAGLE